MTTRRQRRAITIIEAWEDQDRLSMAIAQAESYASPIDPATLARLFETDPAAAWLSLSRLTSEQLVVEAIDYTSWLSETSGRTINWYQVLTVFERRIGRLSVPEVARC